MFFIVFPVFLAIKAGVSNLIRHSGRRPGCCDGRWPFRLRPHQCPVRPMLFAHHLKGGTVGYRFTMICLIMKKVPGRWMLVVSN